MGPAGQGTELHAPSIEEGTAIGTYVVGECIGIGGFGEVYRARHSVIGRDVAIKVLHRRYSHDADAIARFVAEARAVNRVSHPGIVEIHDFGTVDGRQYCVMELVSGRTLRDVLRERTRLPLDEALPILTALAEAIDAAHSAGVAHRDIKPDNIFITKDGVKLVDFGLAKLTRGEDEVPVTQTGAVFGTPLYMSPEQCRGKKVGLETDRYSFGVVAYQMLVGQTPFSGDALELALHHLNDPPPTPGIDERVDRVLLALLAKDPAERPPVLREAVHAMVGEAPLPTVRSLRRGPRFLVPLVLAALAAVFGIGWVALGRGSPAASPAADVCASGASRLQGIWDVPMRSFIAGRFAAVDREDVAAAWHAVAGNLDGYTARWAKQWDAACHSADKTNDALLYVQRQTCLDNAYIALRGVTQSLTRVEIASFSESHTGDFVLPALVDCESTGVLRAQKPAPPPDKRQAVAAQLLETFNARADVRAQINAGRTSNLERGLARLARAIDELEKLHLPAAVEPAYWYATYLASLKGDRLPAGRKALAHLHELATRIGDDRAQAMAFYEDALLEMNVSDDAARAEHIITLGEEAAARAGSPWLATLLLQRLRGVVEVRMGRLDDGLDHMRQAARSYETLVPTIGGYNASEDLVRFLSAAGRHEQAIAEARHMASMLDTTFGGHAQVHVISAHTRLVTALDRSGHSEETLDEARRTLAMLEKLPDLPSYGDRAADLLLEMFVAAARLHRNDVVEDVLTRYRRIRHSDRPIHSRELAGLATQMAWRGDLDAAALAFERATTAEPDTPSDQLLAKDMTAYIAFQRGDVDGTETLATRALADDRTGELHKAGLSPWLLVWVDAVRGHRAAAEARMAKLDRNVPLTQLAQVWSFAVLGQWQEANKRAEAAMKTAPPVPNFDYAEAHAFLGITRAEIGDFPRAIPELENALGVVDVCCDERLYFVPQAQFALARALLATGGDKKRARDLAVAARDGFNPAQAADRGRVDAWLAEHPAS